MGNSNSNGPSKTGPFGPLGAQPQQPVAAEINTNLPTFALTGPLIEEEKQECRNQGLDPDDYTTVRATVLQFQPVPNVGTVADPLNRHPPTQVVQAMATVLLPIDPKLFSGITGPDGQPLMRVDTMLLGAPPFLRVVLRRSMLTEATQKYLKAVEDEMAKNAMLAGLSNAGPLGAALNRKHDDPEG